MSGSSDPSVVRSIAVSAEDLVTAVEMNRTTQREAVLRLTPPFSGRMRARLHVVSDGEYAGEQPKPVHIDPETLLTDDAPAYPRPAETEDEIRNDPETTYSVELHHERHAEAVEAWRARLPRAIQTQTTIQIGTHSQSVHVTILDDFG